LCGRLPNDVLNVNTFPNIFLPFSFKAIESGILGRQEQGERAGLDFHLDEKIMSHHSGAQSTNLTPVTK
jgi:hypothetical protein